VSAGSYDAFLLLGFGGPEGPDDVMPFLENVTRGRGIPRERLEEVSHHYLALGGVSPINAQNRALLAALGPAFAERGIDLPRYWGNRNWAPYLADTLREIAADGHRRVLALATAAYASYSGCRQYREDLALALAETGLEGTLAVDKLRLYFDHPGFVGPFGDGLATALAEVAAGGTATAETRVFFTTHSIPLAMAEASGPPGRFDATGAYVAQHLASIELVVADARRRGAYVPAWQLVYQSRSGAPHVPWLDPDINDALRAARAEGATAAVIVPIGFVSDHVEVVWDIDNEARETAEALGMAMRRVPTPGTHPPFVGAIADLVANRISGEPGEALSPLGPWPSVCAVGCCANLRGEKPTVAGEDSTMGRLVTA
jgi:protoporphyrin/coproporphyrin ferrochelatase